MYSYLMLRMPMHVVSEERVLPGHLSCTLQIVNEVAPAPYSKHFRRRMKV